MAKTQSVQEHLSAMRDELRAATKAHDAEARVRINAALQHAQIAVSQLQVKAAARNEQTIRHLNELAEHARNAMEESGSALHERIDSMIAHAKSAVESHKHA